jgi:hypothetical protein
VPFKLVSVSSRASSRSTITEDEDTPEERFAGADDPGLAAILVHVHVVPASTLDGEPLEPAGGVTRMEDGRRGTASRRPSSAASGLSRSAVRRQD